MEALFKESRKKRKKKGISHRLSKSEHLRVYRLEDEWTRSLINSGQFRESVSEIRKGLLTNEEPIPGLLTDPEHHCTIHRRDHQYQRWDSPIDQLCDKFGVDKGFDLYYGPRYMIERHILFDEPVGNFPHPLVRCETDPDPIPHITRIITLPPSKSLSADELNWLLLDLEFLVVEREPVYPFSPTECEDLFRSLEGATSWSYKERLKEAVDKRIIADPAVDAHTLVALIEDLRDERSLSFGEIGFVLDLSEGAVRKRYVRATAMQSEVSLWTPPRPRIRRARGNAN